MVAIVVAMVMISYDLCPQEEEIQAAMKMQDEMVAKKLQERERKQ